MDGSNVERIEYIDVTKGIGIMSVLLGHSISLMAHPVNRFILSFHMPLFFFVSGMLFSDSYSLSRMAKSNGSCLFHCLQLAGLQL